MTNHEPTESQIQIAFFQIVRLMENMSDEWGMIYAIPNGGKRHIKTAATMKAEGQKAGVWDIFIAVPRGKFHGAYIETKREKYRNRKNGGLTDSQVAWGEKARSMGYYTAIGYTAEELQAITEEYLNL